MNGRNGHLVRRANGAGRWFPAGRPQLQAMVRRYIEAAEVPPLDGPVVAAIAPHAGYVYSGKVAGYTYRAIRDGAAGNGPASVLVLGLSHHGGFRGVALMDGDAIETPLGRTPLDRAGADMLAAATPRIFRDYGPHAVEHSAENQIPFVQTALPDAALVVGLVGDHDAQTLDALHAALAAWRRRQPILVVASSDLLHDPDDRRVRRTDEATLQTITRMRRAELQDNWDYSRQTCCGIGPVLAAMRFAESQGCAQGTLLCYRNSADDFPESRGNWVVGYGAVVFCAGR
jgi:AmmeMemoRadiSam system protein B